MNATHSLLIDSPEPVSLKPEGRRRRMLASGVVSVKKLDPRRVERVMRSLALSITGMELPAIEKISESQAEDPFQILIATLLSARTQDATTHAASTRLFKRARTARSLARLPLDEIERLIYPVGFYRTKARHVHA